RKMKSKKSLYALTFDAIRVKRFEILRRGMSYMAYEEARKKLRGSICPVLTPFTEDGVVDEQTFKQLVNWQIESGSDGISVSGTSAETSSLTTAGRKCIMHLATGAIDSRFIFTPGTGSTNHDETMELTKYAEEIGADAAMVIGP